MKIIIDKDEKTPYVFQIPSITKKLPTGDYSIEGFEDSITIERKSLNDFVNSFTQERERELKKVKRMQKFEFAAYVIEGDFNQIRSKEYSNPEVYPNSIIGTILSLLIHYKIPVIMCTDRQNGLDVTLRLLEMFYNTKVGNSRKKRTEKKETHVKRINYEDIV